MRDYRPRLPTITHYAVLLVGFVVLMFLGKDQWFFGDDWAILAPRLDSSVMAPHVGHWNLTPALVFPALRNLVGLGSYLPFLALAVFAHLAVVHLIWRLLSRVGTRAWLATLLSIFVLFLGASAENVFWAFQFGFMGAIALGLLALLLLDRAKLNVPLIIVASVLAPTFSGTALPVLAAAAIVGWVRHGFRKTALLLLPAAVCYLVWFALIGSEHPAPGAGIHSVADIGTSLLFAAAMYGAGLGRTLPFIPLGVIPAAIIAIWFFRTVRRGMPTRATAAYALVIGSVVFVSLTAYSRMSFGLTAAAAERYAYVTVVLLLPAVGLMLTALAARGRPFFVGSIALLGLLIGFNVVLLVAESGVQAAREEMSKKQIIASLGNVLANPTDPTLLEKPADPEWAPDLLGSDLLVLYDDGQFRP
jgi:hypothetical protein